MARRQRYPVALSADERQELEQVVRAGVKRDADRARMLLWSDDGKSDLEIASNLNVTPLTVAQARRRWAEIDTPVSGSTTTRRRQEAGSRAGSGIGWTGGERAAGWA